MSSDKSSLSTDQLYELINASIEKQTIKLSSDILASSKAINEKLEKANAKIDVLEKKCLFLERKNRKNNVVIFGMIPGILPNKENLLSNTLNKLNTLLGVHVSEADINNFHTVGNQEGKQGIVLEFISFLKKRSLFQNIQKLKGTNISVVNDLNKEDRENHKLLVKHLKNARESNLDARIIGNQLEVNKKRYSVDVLENPILAHTESETESETGSINTNENLPTTASSSRRIVDQNSGAASKKATILKPLTPAYIQNTRSTKNKNRNK